MIQQTITAATIFSALTFGSLNTVFQAPPTTLAEHKISLENRHAVKSVNDVFKDNILLSVAYMQGRVHSKSDINWDDLRKPYRSEFRLEPGQVFAFHDDILPQYQVAVVKTTNSHFNGEQGFKSDGYLMGDGVCHLASLMYWTALDAGLESYAPVRHDFANIPEIDKQYGVSIYNQVGISSNNMQNLYIKNNQDKPITFILTYDGTDLVASIQKDN